MQLARPCRMALVTASCAMRNSCRSTSGGVWSGRRPDGASPDVDLQLFRIAQEAVTNAIRHGHATRIDITVSYDANQVALSIADNGRGFDVPAQINGDQHREHFGLITMRERVERVGGGLRIESAPGAGTTVHAEARLTNEWL